MVGDVRMRNIGFLLSVSPALSVCVVVDGDEDETVGASDTTGDGDGDAPQCGNGAIEAGEQCDSDAFGEATCESLGVGTGELACTPQCSIDASGCSDVMPTSDDGHVTDAGEGPDTGVPEDTGYTDGYTDTGYSDTGPIGPSPACQAYATVVSTCYGGRPGSYYNYDDSLERCEFYLDYYSGECAAAFEELFACLGALDCRTLPNGCPAEQDALVAACRF